MIHKQQKIFYGFQCNSSAVCESLKGFFCDLQTAWRLVLSMKPWSYIWLEFGLFSTIIYIYTTVLLCISTSMIHIHVHPYRGVLHNSHLLSMNFHSIGQCKKHLTIHNAPGNIRLQITYSQWRVISKVHTIPLSDTYIHTKTSVMRFRAASAPS